MSAARSFDDDESLGIDFSSEFDLTITSIVADSWAAAFLGSDYIGYTIVEIHCDDSEDDCKGYSKTIASIDDLNEAQKALADVAGVQVRLQHKVRIYMINY